MPARPIAVLRLQTADGLELKILGVPVSDPTWNSLEGVEDLPGDLAREIEHFFESFSELEGKDWNIEGWGTREEAAQEIERARERFRSKRR